MAAKQLINRRYRRTTTPHLHTKGVQISILAKIQVEPCTHAVPRPVQKTSYPLPRVVQQVHHRRRRETPKATERRRRQRRNVQKKKNETRPSNGTILTNVTCRRLVEGSANQYNKATNRSKYKETSTTQATANQQTLSNYLFERRSDDLKWKQNECQNKTKKDRRWP